MISIKTKKPQGQDKVKAILYERLKIRISVADELERTIELLKTDLMTCAHANIVSIRERANIAKASRDFLIDEIRFLRIALELK